MCVFFFLLHATATMGEVGGGMIGLTCSVVLLGP